MTPSEKCYDIIKTAEQLRLKVYKCPAGIWTIGYGHTGKDIAPDKLSIITEEAANKFLIEDVADSAKAVNSFVRVPLNQNQFDALVSFTFNVGSGNFRSSTLLRLLNQGDYDSVPSQLMRWVKGGGHVLPGLEIRRAREADLFSSKDGI